jgi:hypothetical protein
MVNHKRLLGLTLIGIGVSMAFLSSGFNTRSQDKKAPQSQEVDTSKFPIVDVSAVSREDPKKWAKRQAKGKKYNNKYAPPIEQLNISYLTNHSLLSLPALPLKESSAVIVGEIADAKAYLSEDRKQVYSEFIVSIQSVLKNNSTQAIAAGGSVEVERFGGRALLPSGKTAVVAVDDQDMPRVGGKYVLFLTANENETFTILTGYELRDGKVFPLDHVSSSHPMAQYKGQDEATLLNDLLSVLGNSSTSSRLN